MGFFGITKKGVGSASQANTVVPIVVHTDLIAAPEQPGGPVVGPDSADDGKTVQWQADEVGGPIRADAAQTLPRKGVRRLSEAHGQRHRSRLSNLSRQFLDDIDVPARPNVQDELDAAGKEAGAPEWLRGTVLRQWLLRRSLLERIQCMVEGDGDGASGLVVRFGFQAGTQGAARSAVEALSSDLVGAGGPCPDGDSAISDLHERVFANFNTWALQVGGRPVYSQALDLARSCGDVSSSELCGIFALPGHAPPSVPEPTDVSAQATEPVDAALFDAGADSNTRLYELALWYAIRAEAANLRFMPEMQAWIFHQMRWEYRPPPVESILEHIADGDSSFFHRTTVVPLYQHIKNASRKSIPVGASGDVISVCVPCCRKRGRDIPTRNSTRPNYDDFNEAFWVSSCLSVTYHDLDEERGLKPWFSSRLGTKNTLISPRAAPGAALSSIPKTFREKSSWSAIVLSFYRWYAFQAILFHALFNIAWDTVAQGGINLADIGRLDAFTTIVSASGAFETLGYTHLILVLAAAAHAAPSGSPNFWADALPHLSIRNLLKLVYALGWAGALIVAANSQDLIGADLYGGPIWLGLVGARIACLLVAEGALSSCGCNRGNSVRRFFLDMEHVYDPFPRSHVKSAYWAQGKHPRAVVSSSHMREPVRITIQYTLFWVFLLLAKAVFDLHIVIQQVRLVRTVQEAGLDYLPAAQFSLFGYRHGLILVGSWATIACLFAVDSYIVFILGAPIVGYLVCRSDGLGKFTRSADIGQSFTSGLGGPLRRARPLADQFVALALPLASVRNVDANTVFRRPWDQFVMTLRASDLISNAEQCRLMYGDGVLGVENQLPLFMYAGKVRKLVRRARKVAMLSTTCSSDEEFRLAAVPDSTTEEALCELFEAVPHILALVAASHSAVGYSDSVVLGTILSLFRPAAGCSLRETAAMLLMAEGDPIETMRSCAGIIAQLMVEFEKEGANTRLRGSPLLRLSVQLIIKLYALWHPSHHRLPNADGGTSFAAPTLDAIATAAAEGVDVEIAGTNGDSMQDNNAQAHGRSALNSNSIPTTRTLPGLLLLLSAPNEGSGALHADNDPETSERLEALRESSRRVFYLLTMDAADGCLSVPEAERRMTWFINSLYMPQVPMYSHHDPLNMPSLTIVTPHYGEAVLYSGRDFLSVPNRHGVTPMVYLKSLHGHEWSNFCERLGVQCESEAWKATTDACGVSCSGEMEVRLWASHRGQTLARTVNGMMQAARAIRLLATLQLELEYATIEENRPAMEQRHSPEEIEAHAAQAAVWFTAEKFSYVIAAQRYAEHGEDDVRRRTDIDYLLLTHPLLSVAHFESGISAYSGKRRLMTVFRNGAGVKYRVPCPGNPIVDGIGEGKPENQNSAAPFILGRVLQTIDMNQDGYLEEWLKLPNAMALLTGVHHAPLEQDEEDGIVRHANRVHGRDLVVLGLREHIFTCSLSAPAYFMSAQEYLFGTMWQRIMARPFRVRMHYGHPDLFDKVFMVTRGGTAKASSIINVSEDIFAGFSSMVRGGDSGHCEFLQIGKGRDVGMLQIEVFESKISGGTAISMTSRDSFRVFAGMDFARLLSFYHTGGGFYISNVLVVTSLMSTLYYMGTMALTGADKAILASNYVYLVGDLTLVQWFVQLGMLTVIPLAALYALEGGLMSALTRTLRMFGLLSPLYFMFEIQTKAYYFDMALTFGRQGYMATGRDFVIRHVSFDEIFRAAGQSHLHLGIEAGLLLVIATARGTFESMRAYLFFFLTSWLFTVSLLLAASWFNPLAFDWPSIKADWREWWAWLHAEPELGIPGKSGIEGSWSIWYSKEVEAPYLSANFMARLWRTIRVTRLLLPASLLLIRISRPSDGPLLLALTVGVAMGTLIALQLVHVFTAPCPQRSRVPQKTCCVCRSPVRSVAMAATFIGGCAAVVLFGFIGMYKTSVSNIVDAVSAYIIVLAWIGRVANISSLWPLKHGTRAVHKLMDGGTGLIVLATCTVIASMCPLGGALHNRLLFNRKYGDTMEVITGVRDALDRLNKDAGAKYLKVKSLGAPEFAGNTGAGKENGLAMENRIGVRQFRLKKIKELNKGQEIAHGVLAAGVGLLIAEDPSAPLKVYAPPTDGTEDLIAQGLHVSAAGDGGGAPGSPPVWNPPLGGLGGFGGAMSTAHTAPASASGGVYASTAAGPTSIEQTHIRRTARDIMSVAQAKAKVAPKATEMHSQDTPPEAKAKAHRRSDSGASDESKRSASVQPRGRGAAGQLHSHRRSASGDASVRSAGSIGSVSALRKKFDKPRGAPPPTAAAKHKKHHRHHKS